jgi:hypothetical protein
LQPSRHSVHQLLSVAKGINMNEYVFEVKLRAVVRVRATDEDIARKVIPSVLGASGSLEVDLANQNNAAVGRAATVTEVDFMQENGSRVLECNAAQPDTSPLTEFKQAQIGTPSGCSRAIQIARMHLHRGRTSVSAQMWVTR